jgi:aryl-alcohol dehydrogenase-like predicted oxidoreductase
MAFKEKIAIGTAQFGLNYGISNQAGQSSFRDVCEILQVAATNNLDTLDTAVAYGNSQQVLGEALTETGLTFKIVSKLSGREGPVAETLGESLEKLQLENLYGCLFHDFKNFQNQPQLFNDLLEKQSQGKISKIGFSLYYPEQAEFLLNSNLKFNLVQVPYSLFDQRFQSVFEKLKKAGVEIHTRSVFLQGLFFLTPENLHPYFKEIQPQLEAVKTFASENQIPLSLMLLSFAVLNPYIDKIVLGVENADQLRQNLKFEEHLAQVKKLYTQLELFALNYEQYLLPFNWKTN